jgi:hypothetical protein
VLEVLIEPSFRRIEGNGLLPSAGSGKRDIVLYGSEVSIKHDVPFSASLFPLPATGRIAKRNDMERLLRVQKKGAKKGGRFPFCPQVQQRQEHSKGEVERIPGRHSSRWIDLPECHGIGWAGRCPELARDVETGCLRLMDPVQRQALRAVFIRAVVQSKVQF